MTKRYLVFAWTDEPKGGASDLIGSRGTILEALALVPDNHSYHIFDFISGQIVEEGELWLKIRNK